MADESTLTAILTELAKQLGYPDVSQFSEKIKQAIQEKWGDNLPPTSPNQNDITEFVKTHLVAMQHNENNHSITVPIFSEHLNILANGCGGGRKGQTEVCTALNQHTKDLPVGDTFYFSAGDNQYPTVYKKSSDDSIAKSFSAFKGFNNVREKFIALGNHEAGFIGRHSRHKAKDLNDAKARTQRFLDFFEQGTAEQTQGFQFPRPYYSVKFKLFGSDQPFTEVFVIDSSTLPIDKNQQTWFKNAVKKSNATHKILVSHHAIGQTIDRRWRTTDESAIYFNTEKTGNQHEILASTFNNLSINPETNFKSILVAHYHGLGAVKNTLFTGGGSIHRRKKAEIFSPGQEFPPVDDLKQSKTGGFGKVTLTGETVTHQLIDHEQKILCEYKPQALDTQKPLDQATLNGMQAIFEKYVIERPIFRLLNLVLRALTLNKFGRHHIERAESIARALGVKSMAAQQPNNGQAKILSYETINALLAAQKPACPPKTTNRQTHQISNEKPEKHLTTLKNTQYRGRFYQAVVEAEKIAYQHAAAACA